MKLQSKFAAVLLSAAAMTTLALSGCNTDTGIPAVNSPAVVSAPVAAPLNLTGLGGSVTTRTAANGLLSVGTPNGAAANAAVNQATTLGGRVTINNDGSFTYQAPLTGNTNDSFSFTITNAGGSSTSTVTIALGAQAFFVKNDVAASGNGQQSTPFKTLTEAVTAATGVNAAEIVVFQGDGTTTGYNAPVTLGGNQTLRGFSPAATPLLTGPIVFTTGNRLQDVRINGTTGSAINGTAGVNGTVDRVTITNATSAGLLTNATGTWNISNCAVSGMTTFGFGSASTVGNLVWTVSNSTFSGGATTFCGVCEQPSGTAVQNMTVTGCTFTNTSTVVVIANTTATNVGATVSNCVVTGGGVTPRGVDIAVQGTTAFVGLITGNNITGCDPEGIFARSTDNSSARIKFSGNRTIGNRPTSDFSVGRSGAADFCMVFANNTASEFGFAQNPGGAMSVEQFASFATRNVGTLSVLGNVTDVVAGFCGLP